MDRAFLLDKDKCEGCTNCMRKCPTEAIRLVNNKAIINIEKCIHCGECIRVCPYNAYAPHTDKLVDKDKDKISIVIPSVTVYGQFGHGTETCKIHRALLSIGFDYVYDESWGAELVSKAISKKLREKDIPKPLINSNCPAVIRLIKVKYPSLLEHMIEIQSPMEIAAKLAMRKVKEIFKKSNKPIEVFYISPCPAKAISVIKPIGMNGSSVDKVISFKEIYGDLVRAIKMQDDMCFSTPSLTGLQWCISGGQAKAVNADNSISVSGIENVMDILDEIELGKLEHVDFVELMSCNGSCVGGSFNFENPFVAKNNINYIIKNTDDSMVLNDDLEKFDEFEELGYFEDELNLNDIKEKKIDLKAAIKRMEEVEKIYGILPRLDCGSCGSPTCRALAEDIVDGINELDSCVILKLRNRS